jgi:hypothetical protein
MSRCFISLSARFTSGWEQPPSKFCALLDGRRTIKQEEIYIHLKGRYHLGEKKLRRLLTSFLTGLDQLGALARGKP